MAVGIRNMQPRLISQSTGRNSVPQAKKPLPRVNVSMPNVEEPDQVQPISDVPVIAPQNDIIIKEKEMI